MAEIKNYTFSHLELTEILIKKLGIQEGLWGISIEFSFTATNLPVGPDLTNLLPASVSLISKIGVQRFDSPNNLTVDASKINPAEKPRKKKFRAL